MLNSNHVAEPDYCNLMSRSGKFVSPYSISIDRYTGNTATSADVIRSSAFSERGYLKHTFRLMNGAARVFQDKLMLKDNPNSAAFAYNYARRCFLHARCHRLDAALSFIIKHRGVLPLPPLRYTSG